MIAKIISFPLSSSFFPHFPHHFCDFYVSTLLFSVFLCNFAFVILFIIMDEQMKNIISAIEGVKDVHWKYGTNASGELYFGIDRWKFIISSASAGRKNCVKNLCNRNHLENDGNNLLLAVLNHVCHNAFFGIMPEKSLRLRELDRERHRRRQQRSREKQNRE